jgi:hypothetical protein
VERAPERIGAAGPEVAERDRMPEAARLAGQRRASRVRPASSAAAAVSSPFGAEASTPPPSSDPTPDSRRDEPESLEPPVVAVLPSFPMPGGPLDPETPAGGSAVSGSPDEEGRDEERPRRRFGLRRPRD